MLPFFCPGKRKVTERKPARPRYAKFAMQLLRLGSGEKNLHTFFLNDQKESVQRKSRRHRFIGQFLHHNIYG